MTARPRQAATVPLGGIDVADVGASAARFNAWLLRATQGQVNLAGIKNVAGAMPVMGNVIALADVLDDFASLVDGTPATPGALEWAGLGIHLIGVLPAPETASVRMSLRPMLALVRQEVLTQMGAGRKAELGAAILATLQPHLNAGIKGDIENFLSQVRGRVGAMLQECGAFGERLALDLARGIEQVATGHAGAATGQDGTHQSQRLAGRTLVRDPKKTIANYLQAEFDAYKALTHMEAHVGSGGAKRDTTAGGASRHTMAAPQVLRAFAPRIVEAMQTLAEPGVQHSIVWLIDLMCTALAAWRRRGDDSTFVINVPVGHRVAVQRVFPQQPLESIRHQAPARGSPNPCKNCPAPAGTGPSISFATGDESFSHTDFTLPGPFPIDWTRTYRSSLDAYDDGPFGARWVSPFTTRLDVRRERGVEALRYHAPDGRSHAFPLPPVGQTHHDPVENLTLLRPLAHSLVIAHGHALRALYQRHGERFRLAALERRGGARLALFYEHRLADGRIAQAPSDLVTYLGDVPQAHLGTRLDAAGRIASVWRMTDGQPTRALAHYNYDDAGDLVRAHDRDGAARDYTYRQHLVTRYTDRTGRGMQLAWRGDGPDARAVREWADDGSLDTRLDWDPHIRMACVTDALGHQAWHYFDIQGYTCRIRHADGRSEWFYRDAARNVVQHVHADGTLERYAWDARGNLLEHIRADHSAVHYAYDEHDLPIKVRDAEGGLWLRDYDLKGNVTEATDPLGHKTAYAYNRANLPVQVTDARGGVTRLAYNAAGQLTAHTDCSGQTRAWRYDDEDRLASATDAAGGVTRYTYAAGQLARIDHPDQRAEQFEHDAEGRLLAHTDALHRRTTWRYDDAGRIAGRTDAAGQTLAYRWDRLGRLVGLTNENHASCTFGYDPVGRLLAETGFDGRARRYRYAADTGGLSRIDEGEWRTALSWDAMGRLTGRSATRVDAQGQAVGAAQAETFAYDGNGRLTLARNADSRLQWFYDAAGNLVREHQHYQASQPNPSNPSSPPNQSNPSNPFNPSNPSNPPGRPNPPQPPGQGAPVVAVWRHEYDELNHRVATIRPDGHRVTVLTYGSGHVHGVRIDDAELVQIERDALHREVLRTQGNRITQAQAWDAAGRLVEQTLAREDRPHAYVNRRTYRHDAAGQISGIRDLRRGELSYQYDPVGRLLVATGALGTERFAFDPAGNLLDDPTLRTFEADPLTGRAAFGSRLQGRPALVDNLLRDYAGTHYAWDGRGNLTERRIHGTLSRFHWDAFNRLVRYEDGRLSVRYRYDALGRRIAKTSIAHDFGNPRDGALYRQNERARVNRELDCAHTLYGWDGDTLAWECRTPHAQSFTSGGHALPSLPSHSQTTHYLYEPDTFVPLAQAIRTGPIGLIPEPPVPDTYDIDEDPLWLHDPTPPPIDTLAWYQCDHLGTPQEITGPDGETAWTANYKAWGEATEALTAAARKAGIRNPLRFQGQYHDHETGLHYNRHRYYDPHSGRFLSKDPIGLAGGLNLHLYADNPTGWIDPLGLDRIRNAVEGARREDVFNAQMRAKHPNATIQCQCYLRNAQGQSVKDPDSGERRRIDTAVIENGRAQTYEVTSPTADKTLQAAKEQRILDSGGKYIRDRSSGTLVPVNGKSKPILIP